MRFLSIIFGVLLALCCTTFAPKGASAADDGKSIFLDGKCNECHAIASQGIEVAKSDDGALEEDPFGGDDEGDDEEAPDLSGVGKEQNAEWIADYLKKKVKLDGKKHRKRFKGSADELKVLSEWLASLKADAPAN